MKVLITILVVIASLTFIAAGLTGSPSPFGNFLNHSIIVRVFEILIGVSLLLSLRN